MSLLLIVTITLLPVLQCQALSWPQHQSDLEWPQMKPGYSSAVFGVGAQSSFAQQQQQQQQQQDCTGPIASKTCQCTDNGRRVVCRNTIVYSLQNDVPCPQLVEHLTMVNAHFKSQCLTRDNLTALTGLRTLAITGSNLQMITRDAFRNQRLLEKLDLHDNLQLTSVDADMLAYLPRLKQLDMSGCSRLHQLDRRFLEKSNHLLSLNLSSIGLRQMPLLPTSASLRILDVSRNQLKTLPSEMIPHFCRLQQVQMADNPWCCSRQSRWLSMFLRIVSNSEQQQVVRDEPICNAPVPLQGWPIRSVSPDRMDSFERCDASQPFEAQSCSEVSYLFFQYSSAFIWKKKFFFSFSLQIYGMFRNVMPQLPAEPENRVMFDNKRGNVIHNHHLHIQQQSNTGNSQRGGARGSQLDNRVWKPVQVNHHRLGGSVVVVDHIATSKVVNDATDDVDDDDDGQQLQQEVVVASRFCLAAIGGDCTTGHIVIGVLAALVGAVLVAFFIVLIKCCSSGSSRAANFRRS